VKIHNKWEFDTIGIYNFNINGPYKPLFDFIKKNHKKIKGDIVETGVFKGSTILALGLFLKKIKSNKKIFGFDSFSGFPSINLKKDDLSLFYYMYKKRIINKNHYNQVKQLISTKKIIYNNKIKSKEISTSQDFSNVDIKLLKKKIKFLGLNNIRLIKGPFKKTLIKRSKPNKIMAAFIDCDLYDSYMDSLNFIWPRLSKKGLIQLDEYYSLKFPGARLACDEFFRGKKHKKKKYIFKNNSFERWVVLKK